MILKIADIGPGGTEIDFSEKIAVEGEPGRELPVKARLKAFKDGESVFISGNINADIIVQCSRCLKEFSSDIDIGVNVTCMPEDKAEMDDKRELSVEEFDISYYSSDAIDIDSLISEHISVSMPIKPLCSDECKGLCIQCGTNLNERQCYCTQEVIDERWMKLKKLKNERMD